MIIGATPESDYQVMTVAETSGADDSSGAFHAYPRYAEQQTVIRPVNSPLLREHRLYQADWLLRFYDFTVEELLTEDRYKTSSLRFWAMPFCISFIGLKIVFRCLFGASFRKLSAVGSSRLTLIL